MVPMLHYTLVFQAIRPENIWVAICRCTYVYAYIQYVYGINFYCWYTVLQIQNGI